MKNASGFLSRPMSSGCCRIYCSLAVGDNINYQLEAQLSVISFLAFSDDYTEVHLYTDRPNDYKWLNHARVKIWEINREQLSKWTKDKHGEYFFRAKLKFVEAVSTQNPLIDIIWFDTDCVAVDDLSSLHQSLTENVALMHKAEDPFSKGDTKAERRYWKALKDKPYAGVQATEKSCQWNSGILGIPSKGKERIALAVRVLDELRDAKVPGRTLEQVAAGLALEHSGNLKGTDSHILHYWANKSVWHTFALKQLFVALNLNVDIQKMVDDYRCVVSQNKLPAIVAPRPSRAERHKKRWRKRLRLLAPCEKH